MYPIPPPASARPSTLLRVLGFLLGSLAFGFASPAKVNPAPVIPPGVKVIGDIVYVHREGGRPLKLDLYLPPAQDSPLPLAIWIHGGGWTMGSKRQWVNPIFLTTRGFALASINYRLSSEAPFPAQIEDCKAAVQFLRANASTYGLDPGRIAAIGESAGGNLAALLGTTTGSQELSDAPRSPVSDRVQAVIDLFGPADLTKVPDVTGTGAGTPNTVPFFVHRLLGGNPSQLPALAREASPACHIPADAPPFLILHGKGDPLVPAAQSQMFYDALQKAGIPSELILVPVSYHAGPGFWTPPMRDKMVSFLDGALKRP